MPVDIYHTQCSDATSPARLYSQIFTGLADIYSLQVPDSFMYSGLYLTGLRICLILYTDAVQLPQLDLPTASMAY